MQASSDSITSLKPLFRTSILMATAIVYATSFNLVPPGYTAEKSKLCKRSSVNHSENVEEADLLYDRAKANFENGDMAKAEEIMRKALTLEQAQERPSALLRTEMALASILAALRRYDDALSMYQQALKTAEQNGQDDQIDTLINNIGALFMVMRKYDDAESFFQKANQSSENHRNSAGQANALINLAVIKRLKKDYQGAIDYLDKATSLTGSNTDPHIRASIFMESGRAYADFGSYIPASVCYQKAINAFEEDGDDMGTAKALTSLGKIYLSQRKPEQAYKSLVHAFEILSKERTSPLFIDCEIMLGAAQADLGNFSEAEKLHNQALETATASHKDKLRIQCLSELAYDYFLQGAIEKALNRFAEGYSLLCESPFPKEEDKAPFLRDIGMCFHALGQTAAAIKYLSAAAQSFEQTNDIQNQALAYNSLAVAFLDGGAVDQFEVYYQKAKGLLGSSKDKRIDAYLTYNYAQYCMIDSRFADALPMYETALANYKSLNDIKGECQVMCGLGLLYSSLGRLAKAQEYYQQAAVLASKIGSIEAQWDSALGLGKVYKAMGNNDLAERNLQKAVMLVDQERSQLSRDTFKTFNMDFRQDCFAELIDLLIKDNKPEEALEIAEKGRARAFIDLLESRRKGRSVTKEISQLKIIPEEVISTKEPNKSYIALTNANKPNNFTAVERGVEVFPRAPTSIETSAISPSNVAAPSLSEIKSLVNQSNSFVVEYYVLPHKILSWVIKPNGQIILAPPVVINKRELTEKIQETYLSIVTHPQSPKEAEDLAQKRQQNLKELYKILIDPVANYLPTSSDQIITLVPHGSIFSVPFAALISPDSRFLIEEHTLAYTPAIGVMRATYRLEEESISEKNRLLAFGNPITQAISFLGKLPYAEKEVKKVASLFGPNASTVKIGANATKESFQTLAPQNTVLHLATHGIINEEHPMDSALVLAPNGNDDGLLTVKDILLLPALKAKMVVLSACQTGRGKITGDGVVGLSRAFIIAGTPSVLVSQWNVDDVMTEFQMEALYENYLQDKGKARSLREAQLKTIAFMEKTILAHNSLDRHKSLLTTRANPRYWAAFQLIGEYK